jgi:hypothetical protein
MRAELKALDLEPDPSTLPEGAEHFALLARVYAGPAGAPGEESFDVTVCSPEWLAAACRPVGLYDARHHVVVTVDQFDRRELRTWLEKRVRTVTGETWDEIGAKLARLGHWELEDFRE